MHVNCLIEVVLLFTYTFIAKDIKELARLYKANALSRFNKGCSKKDVITEESQDMKVY